VGVRGSHGSCSPAGDQITGGHICAGDPRRHTCAEEITVVTRAMANSTRCLLRVQWSLSLRYRSQAQATWHVKEVAGARQLPPAHLICRWPQSRCVLLQSTCSCLAAYPYQGCAMPPATSRHMSTGVVRDMLAGRNPVATGDRLASRSEFGYATGMAQP
jgi:hypothetical protein